jgi:hypothetical protein
MNGRLKVVGLLCVAWFLESLHQGLEKVARQQPLSDSSNESSFFHILPIDCATEPSFLCRSGLMQHYPIDHPVDKGESISASHHLPR